MKRLGRFCALMLVVFLAIGYGGKAAGQVCGDGVIEGEEVCDNGHNNGTPGYCKIDCSGFPALVSLSGDVFPFNVGHTARLDRARISILEYPMKRMTTGPDGHFNFDGLEEGTEVTLVMERPILVFGQYYHLIQTGTIPLGPDGAERVTFQAVTHLVYTLLALYIRLVPDDDNACQMVTTVTRVGKSLYDPGAHGEEGATVTVDPPLPPEHGPIYFNSSVLPDRSLTETSDDGGVLYVNVPPGEYVLTAHKPGVEFRPVKMKCRSGYLVNASPPWGLQALE
jgi:hypothetical protein